MKDNQPLVSIIMPVYNGDKYLAMALETVMAQTYKNWELIVVDDASTDTTAKILARYNKRSSQIKIIANAKNQGVAKSLNNGIGLAHGEFIARMGADDMMDRERIEKQVQYLKDNPSTVVVGTFMREIDENGKVVSYRKLPIKHARIYAMMNYMMGVQHPTLMFNTQLIPASFGWYRNVSMVEDLDLLFRLTKFGTFANIPDYLHDYRVHKTNESLRSIKETFNRALEVRINARQKLLYKPSIGSILLQGGSRLFMNVMPEGMIYSAYQFLRKI